MQVYNVTQSDLSLTLALRKTALLGPLSIALLYDGIPLAIGLGIVVVGDVLTRIVVLLTFASVLYLLSRAARGQTAFPQLKKTTSNIPIYMLPAFAIIGVIAAISFPLFAALRIVNAVRARHRYDIKGQYLTSNPGAILHGPIGQVILYRQRDSQDPWELIVKCGGSDVSVDFVSGQEAEALGETIANFTHVSIVKEVRGSLE